MIALAIDWSRYGVILLMTLALGLSVGVLHASWFMAIRYRIFGGLLIICAIIAANIARIHSAQPGPFAIPLEYLGGIVYIFGSWFEWRAASARRGQRDPIGVILRNVHEIIDKVSEMSATNRKNLRETRAYVEERRMRIEEMVDDMENRPPSQRR